MRRLIALVVSVLILAFLYTSLDTSQLRAALVGTDPIRLGFSLILLLVLTGLSATRLWYLARAAGGEISGAVALRATLAANALNLFLPGRMGDVLKATLMRDPITGSAARGVNIAIFEKVADVVAVLVCGAVALAVTDMRWGWYSLSISGTGIALCVLMLWTAPVRVAAHIAARLLPPKFGQKALGFAAMWRDMVETVRRQPGRLFFALTLTLLIWMGHFVQIAMMAWALGASGPWLEVMVLFPIMILSGLLPMTIAGIGPRDAATVVLAGPLIGDGAAAALGVLFLLRYLVPGLLGLGVLPEFSRSLHSRSQQTRPKCPRDPHFAGQA
jgi:glycosyltransferase 2 family protein